jgi:hypothetical protein
MQVGRLIRVNGISKLSATMNEHEKVKRSEERTEGMLTCNIRSTGQLDSNKSSSSHSALQPGALRKEKGKGQLTYRGMNSWIHLTNFFCVELKC